MPKYYRIDMGTGEVSTFTSDAIPAIDKEALIVHETLVSDDQEKQFPDIHTYLERDSLTREKYLERFDMGDFGEGVRAKVDIYHDTPVELIYSGVHVPNTTAVYSQLAAEQPDFGTWEYQAALGELDKEGAVYLLSKEPGCMAHMAQHLPKVENIGPLKNGSTTFATENLEQDITVVRFQCGDKALSFKMTTITPKLTEGQKIKVGQQVGWDYGPRQWYARKVAPVLFHKANPSKVCETILIRHPNRYELESLMLNKHKLTPAFIPIHARFLPKELVPDQPMTEARHMEMQRLLTRRSIAKSAAEYEPRTAKEAGETRALIFCDEMKEKISQGDNFTDEAVFIVAKRSQIREEPEGSQQYFLDLKLKGGFDREGLLSQFEKLKEIGMPHEKFSKMISESGQVNVPVDFLKQLSITRTCLFMQVLSPHLTADEYCRLQAPNRLRLEVKEQIQKSLAPDIEMGGADPGPDPDEEDTCHIQ